jgi:chromosome segregation ATPase
MRSHPGDDYWTSGGQEPNARKYVEQLEGDLEDALQQLRDASPVGSRNLRASLDKANKELAKLKDDNQVEKFKGMLQENGVAITRLQRSVGALNTEVKRLERIRDNDLARIEDLVHDVEVLERENQRLKAAAGINEPLIIRRSL